MEMNKSPSPEKSDSARTANVEQCSSPSQTQARTYECNFCKRGFSNAQALGGHMNIHRKDKAKLKQTSPLVEPPRPQQFLLEIPKTTLPSPNKILSARSTIPDNRSASVAATWTWNYGSEKNDTRSDQMVVSTEPRQLPLFDETTTVKVDHDQDQMESSSSSSHRGDEQDNELDLELRLGNEPGFDSSSSSAKGTRKFF